MKHPTYTEMADYYKIDLDELGWEDRRMTYAGLRNFLIAYYEHQQLIVYGRFPEPWELKWRSNVYAYIEALEQWHRRLPRKLSFMDRARVAELLGPKLIVPDTPRMAQARRWAANRT